MPPSPLPQQVAELQDLLKQMSTFLEALKSSNSIPREVETALRERLGDIKNILPGVAPTTTDSVTIGAGGGSFSFTYPNAVATIAIRIGGKTYNVLVGSITP